MDIRTWPWTGVLVAVVIYWIVLVAGWLVYTTRPSTQARARERDLHSIEQDPETGRVVMSFQHASRLDRVGLVLFGPPILLAALWFFTRVG